MNQIFQEPDFLGQAVSVVAADIRLILDLVKKQVNIVEY